VTNKHLEEQINFSSLETVKQIQSSLDSRLEAVQRAISPLLHDPELLEAVHTQSGNVDYIQLLGVVKKLQALEQSLNDVHSIDIYIPDERILLSTLNGYHKYTSQGYADILAGKLGWGYGRPGGVVNTLSFVKAIPLYSDRPLAYLAVYLNPSLVAGMIGDIAKLGELTVVDAQGFIVADPSDNRASERLPSLILYQYLNRGAMDNYGVIRSEDTSEVLFYAQSRFNSWSILFKVPESRIYSYHQRLIVIYVSLCGLGLLLGALLIYNQSRRLYKPIFELVRDAGGQPESGMIANEWQFIRSQMERKDKLLDDLNTQHQLNVRESFFLELLYGQYVSMSEDWLHKQMIDNGFSPSRRYGVMIAEAERIDESGRFKKDEKALVVLAVSSICKDIVQQLGLKGLILQEVQTGRVILLLQSEEEPNAEPVAVRHDRLAENIRSAVRSYLKFPVSVGIGGYHTEADGLRISYNEALEALQDRLTAGGDRILHVRDRVQDAGGSPSYPVEFEKQILGSLREGDREEVLRNFDLFVLHTMDPTLSGDQIYHFYQMLYTAMNQSYIHLSEHNRERFVELRAYQTINGCRTIQEIKAFFIDSLFPLLLRMAEEQQKSTSGSIVDAVLIWIPDRLHEELSLQVISETFGVSQSYFSRLFAKHTGTTFVEYVAGLRIEASKQKLIQSDAPVLVIAREAGYTEQTFRRVFKQMTGQTPTQFREAQKNDR
jgi:two-component system, response regulator YesN